MSKGVIQQSYVDRIRAEMPGYTFDTLQYVVDCFRRLDADGTGSVNDSEMGGVLEGLGVEATPSQLQTFIEECDVNGDGQIQQDEFIRVLYRRKLNATRRGKCGEKRVWMMENPAKVTCAKRTLSICLSTIMLGLAIFSFAAFANSQENVKGMISTWELVPITQMSWVDNTTACPTPQGLWQGFPTAPGSPDECNCNNDCPKTTVDGACPTWMKNEGCKTEVQSCTTTNTRRLGDDTSGERRLDEVCTYQCDCGDRDCVYKDQVCNSSQTNIRGCSTINGYPRTPLTLWRGKRLCFARQGLSALGREQARGDSTTCVAPNTKTCGAAGSNDTVACFPDNLGCPLATVTLTSTSPLATTSGTDIGTKLPITLFQSAQRSTATANQIWESAIPTNSSGEFFMPSDYTVIDSQTAADYYADNGINSSFAPSSTSFSIGYQNEIGWDNFCDASRKDLDDAEPSLDKLGTMLTIMMTLSILDFIWTIIETYTIASSKKIKWLTVRTVCDIGCYGANLPVIIIAMGAAGIVSGVTGHISDCAPTSELRDSFNTISSRAAQVAGTNLVLLIFKGFKMLFMSALFQYGVWLGLRRACGKKRMKSTMSLALSDDDTPIKASQNPAHAIRT